MVFANVTIAGKSTYLAQLIWEEDACNLVLFDYQGLKIWKGQNGDEGNRKMASNLEMNMADYRAETLKALSSSNTADYELGFSDGTFVMKKVTSKDLAYRIAIFNVQESPIEVALPEIMSQVSHTMTQVSSEKKAKDVEVEQLRKENSMLKERYEKCVKELENLKARLYAEFSIAFNSLKTKVGNIPDYSSDNAIGGGPADNLKMDSAESDGSYDAETEVETDEETTDNRKNRARVQQCPLPKSNVITHDNGLPIANRMNQTLNGSVALSTRADLFRILAFLDGQLPKSAPIHSFVLSAILSRNPSFKVYFIKHSEQDSYSAILGTKNETMRDAKQQLRKIWITSTWEHSDPHQMCRIYDALNEVDWKLNAFVSFGNGDVPDPIILKHLEENHASLCEDHGSPCYQYYIPIEEALAIQVEVPAGVYVKSLEREHAQVVYENWTYKASTTVEHVADEIDQLPSAGVFLKENDKLVSWMVSHPPNGMSRLHTLEGFRRRGYARLLTRYLAKRFAQCGCVPFVNIVRENQPSISFFESLNFRLLGRQYVYVSVPPSLTATDES